MLPKRVFVTGASGFVGTAVIEELLERDYQVNALLHRGDLGPLTDRVRLIRGDIFDPDALDAGVSGCHAVIHLVGIIAEKRWENVTFERMHVTATRSVLESLARAADAPRRYIHMSALGSRPNAVSTYHQTKFAAEELVRAARRLDWTIIRPSMIHGPRGEFTRMQAKWAKRQSMPFLFMPYFGAGTYGFGGASKLQPIYIGDVARAFVDAIENPKTFKETYSIAGPDVVTWPELHHAVSEAIVGKRRMVLPIPAWYAKLLTRVVPASLLPFNRDQVIMSQEDNTTDIAPFVADFGWTPQPLRYSLAMYAEGLGKRA